MGGVGGGVKKEQQLLKELRNVRENITTLGGKWPKDKKRRGEERRVRGIEEAEKCSD